MKEIKNIIKEFLGNVKPYFDYIMTLGFKKLGVHFISLLLIVFIALLIYLPFGLVNDFIVTLLGSLIDNVPDILYGIVDVIIELCSLLSFLVFFMYLFNQRYKDVYKDEIANNGKVTELTRYDNAKVPAKEEEKIELPELDLPKKK